MVTFAGSTGHVYRRSSKNDLKNVAMSIPDLNGMGSCKHPHPHPYPILCKVHRHSSHWKYTVQKLLIIIIIISSSLAPSGGRRHLASCPAELKAGTQR